MSKENKQTISKQLAKCPFCGGEAELLQGVTEIHNYVMCMNCYCKTQFYNTKKRAIQTWNNRKPMDRILERLEEYRAFEDHDSLDRQAIDGTIEIVKEEGGLNE